MGARSVHPLSHRRRVQLSLSRFLSGMMRLSHHKSVTGGTTHGKCTVHRPTVPPVGVPGFHQPDTRRVSATRPALRDRVPHPYGGMADGWETADRTPVCRLQKLPPADTGRVPQPCGQFHWPKDQLKCPHLILLWRGQGHGCVAVLLPTLAGLGHITVDTYRKQFFPTLHVAFKAKRNKAEAPSSSKESCAGSMVLRRL